MSKTHRNYGNHYVYRKPKTFNERKQLEALMYDDIVKSGYYEDYNWKHYWDC